MSRKTMNAKDDTPITDTVISEFLNAQSKKTRKTYLSSFRRVLEFSQNESGAHMLENCAVWERKIMAFQQFLVEKGYSLNTVENHTGMLRGFFAFYKKPLDLSQADRRKLGRKSRSGEDYAFAQEDLKRLDAIADLTEKYVVRCGLSFGVRPEDFVKITYGKYRIALENAQKQNISAPIPLGKIDTGKEGVYAYPFISSDALPIIQAILDSHKDAKDDEPVYIYKDAQLTATVQNLVAKCGIETHGQTVRYYCLRKKLYDSLLSVSSDAKAKQIIGQKISGEISAYIGEGSLREVYERAFPMFSVTNGNGVVVKARVSALEEENVRLKEELKEAQNRIAELEGSGQNFTKMISDLNARLKTLEETERKRPDKVPID